CGAVHDERADGSDAALVSGEGAQVGASGGVPDPDGAVVAGGGEVGGVVEGERAGGVNGSVVSGEGALRGVGRMAEAPGSVTDGDGEVDGAVQRDWADGADRFLVYAERSYGRAGDGVPNSECSP